MCPYDSERPAALRTPPQSIADVIRVMLFIVRTMQRCFVVDTLLCLIPCLTFAASLEVPPPLQQVMRQIRNGKYLQAIESIKARQGEFPQDPLAYLIAGEAYAGIIFCQTAHINSREIWNVADIKTNPYDNGFLKAEETALELGRQLRLNPKSAAVGALYTGLAHGARSRLYLLRDQSLKSASEGKLMRTDLLEAIDQDSQLAPDAYMGLGTYNYYADVLSPILKLFRFFLMIPGGDRELGLEQLRTASERSVLLSEEARYELGHIYGVRESNHSEALSLYKDLAARYPNNPLYALSACYQGEQAGEQNTAIEYCQKASKAVADGDDGGCRERVGTAAGSALERLRNRKAGARATP